MRSFTLLLVLLTLLFFIPRLSQAQGPIFGFSQEHGIIDYALPPQTVVLTFDDGPSKYTAPILDILEQTQVKATFFVVGENVLQYPLLQRIAAAGHDVANHTFTHPHLEIHSPWLQTLQVNSTRLLIEADTGQSTRLFRPPFLVREDLQENEQARALLQHMTQKGYLVIDTDLDSQDWRLPGVPAIIANAINNQNESVIILFHDGGGNRQQTVEALPPIIDHYQSKGYRFATVSEVLHVSRDTLSPPVHPADHLSVVVAKVVFSGWRIVLVIIRLIILAALVLVFVRATLVTGAAIIQARRQRPRPAKPDLPCTIIVPAYNEEKVITSCITSLLASDYSSFKVIVVDDGSRDNTYSRASASNDERLTVVRQKNGGKAAALNHGIRLATTDIIVTVDADTVFTPTTLRHLVQYFINPRVGAVSGNTKVVNRHTLLTKLQSIEYVVGFNLDRRMCDLFDCITVVPGAIGAFRRAAIHQAGYFSRDTVAEDTDLTLGIKEAGYTIVYAPAAIAYTEAPVTVRDLFTQRFRWTFGTMQAIWKHRYAVLNPRYGSLGLLGLPYLIVYQIIFPLLGPFIDLGIVIGLLTAHYQTFLLSVILYTGLDTITTGIALKLDREPLRQLWMVIPQRLLYRQLMYYVIARSLLNVIQGRWAGWHKLPRAGHHLAKV